MKKEEIHKLFAQLAKKLGKIDEKAKPIFTMLIMVTLRYRDILKRQNITLTIKDTQEGLDLLVQALKTGKTAKTHNLHALNLVKIWLDELKKFL